MSWRRFQDIITRCLLEDVLKNKSCNYSFKTSLQDVLEDKKMLRWRRLQDVSKTCFHYYFMSIVTLCSWRSLENILKTSCENVLKTSSRRLWKRSCNHVLKKSWEMKNCYTEEVFKTSSRRLQDVLENEKYLLALKYLPRITHHVYWNF